MNDSYDIFVSYLVSDPLFKLESYEKELIPV